MRPEKFAAFVTVAGPGGNWLKSAPQKSVAMLKLAHWFNEVETSGFKSFSIVKNTITHHYNEILNYFEARSTNASAESFNAKTKNFRLQLRGVKDKAFFLFRLSKLFA